MLERCGVNYREWSCATKGFIMWQLYIFNLRFEHSEMMEWFLKWNATKIMQNIQTSNRKIFSNLTWIINMFTNVHNK